MNPAYVSTEDRRLGDLAPVLLRFGRSLGVAGLVTAAIVGLFNREGLFESYLINFCFFLSLMLGGIFFTLIHHLTRAGWSTAVRRLAEGLGAMAPLMAVLFLPLLLGLGSLYPWTHPGDDPLLHDKAPYLNVPFFLVRIVLCFVAWILISRFYFRTSVAQDASGDVNLTFRMQRFAPVSLIVFAVTLTCVAFDLLMSLDPAWYSTIFGVYYFGGSIGAFFALLIGALLFLQKRDLLTESITTEHLHDLGKFMFAFIVFWAYIAYSQYMLIWYGNIPEETLWYQHRMQGGWGAFSLFLLLGHFVGPFLFVMSRKMKRRKATLAGAAVWMLAMHWVDLYWLVKPGEGVLSVAPSLTDLACFVGLGGLFVAELARRLRGCSLIPEQDPRLGESLAFENF
jgi:hypothetical protein